MEQAWELLNNFKDQQTICYKYDLDVKVGIIKIQRPKHLNALNKYVISDFSGILGDIDPTHNDSGNDVSNLVESMTAVVSDFF